MLIDQRELSLVRAWLDAKFMVYRRHLEDLVAIPSVSAAGFDPIHVRRSAERCAAMLEAAGLSRVRLLELQGAHPYVTGEWIGREDGPTVLLYAHHDVQPPGRIEKWSADPFRPVERDGRLYGRGSADDKAGAVMHAAAVQAWLTECGHLPCNVKVLIEGEEEIGSVHLGEFLKTYGDELSADVMVLADAGNWAVGKPAITYALRGLIDLIVRVRALDAPQHSGMFGGLLPDPVLALAKMLASLVDEQGKVAVPSLLEGIRPLRPPERARLDALQFDEPIYRQNAGLRPGVQLLTVSGRSPWEEVWMQPAIAVIGIDAHPIRGSSNQILAEAAARVSIRLAPGQDPVRCQQAIFDHLRRTAPWGIEVEITAGNDSTPAWVCEPSGPAFDAADEALRAAFGKRPVYMGVGGTIPFVGPFAAAFGGIPAILTGPADPTSRIHSEDESLHIEDWRKHIHAEAILFAEIARRLRPKP